MQYMFRQSVLLREIFSKGRGIGCRSKYILLYKTAYVPIIVFLLQLLVLRKVLDEREDIASRKSQTLLELKTELVPL
jgi:hypothetical protein